MFKFVDNYPFIVLPILFLLAGCADSVVDLIFTIINWSI